MKVHDVSSPCRGEKGDEWLTDPEEADDVTCEACLARREPAFTAQVAPITHEVLIQWGGEDLVAILASVDDGSHSLGYWHPITGEWLVLIEDMDALMRDRLNPDIREF